MVFAKTALTSTLTTTVVWVIVTFLTKPEPDSILTSFYRKVRPQITGWRPIAAMAPEITETRDLGRNLWCWVLGTRDDVLRAVWRGKDATVSLHDGNGAAGSGSDFRVADFTRTCAIASGNCGGCGWYGFEVAV